MSVRKHNWPGLTLALAFLGFGWAAPGKADVITYTITADTSADTGTPGSLDVQFNALGPGGSDTAVITSFSSDGTVGPVNFTTGHVSVGDLSNLPVTLEDDAFPPNELNQAFTFGSTLTITFDITTNAGSPGASFFFTIYEGIGNPIDPASGSINGISAAENDVDPGGNQEPPISGPGVTESPQGSASAVPEPASLFLLLAGGVGLAVFSACRRERYRVDKATS